MRVPPLLNIVLLVLLATAFYTMVGQMVPQKEVPAPEVIEIAENVSTQEMVEIGREIAEGKGICLTCHTIGQSGSLRFPDLEGIGTRAATRIPGMSGVDYLAQSLYEPNAYVVEGFNPGMPVIDKPPIDLTDDEILAVIAYLQSLGGTPTVDMQTRHAYNGGENVEVVEEAIQHPTAAVQEDAEASSVTAASDGRMLFEKYGCAQCHVSIETDAQTSRDVVLASILDPDNIAGLSGPERTRKRRAMEQAGLYQTATLQEVQRIVDYWMEQKANP